MAVQSKPYHHLSWVSLTFPLNFRSVSADKFFIIPLTCFPALSSNAKQSENPTTDRDDEPDHHQNLITTKMGKVSNLPENSRQINL